MEGPFLNGLSRSFLGCPGKGRNYDMYNITLYIKQVQFPLGFEFEGDLLLASPVQAESYMVTTPGHELEKENFGDSETFQLDWE